MRQLFSLAVPLSITKAGPLIATFLAQAFQKPKFPPRQDLVQEFVEVFPRQLTLLFLKIFHLYAQLILPSSRLRKVAPKLTKLIHWYSFKSLATTRQAQQMDLRQRHQTLPSGTIGSI